MGSDEKKGDKSLQAPPPPPKKEKGGKRRVTDGEEEGEGRGGTPGRREVQQPPWPSHPRQEGPGLLHSALALLLKFQLCAQPSWPAASHVPAPGWAAGSGARGGHMDEKPGSAEQRAGRPLGPGTQRLVGPVQPCLLYSTEAADPAFLNTQGGGPQWPSVLSL